MKPDKNINERILELRKSLGLSQLEFAARLNISRTYQSTLEGKGQKVNDRILTLICMTFGVNEGWLRNGDGDMFEKTPDLRSQKIMRNFGKLDVFLQDYILKQVDMLLEFQEIKGIK
ncbi:MAG: helix-turn-helix domain-containing protein [Treponema sp.]|nr:helix-turn-helix domain-containing protein [Treponema sp.]